MTRQQYLDGTITHEEYYFHIAKLAGISFDNSPMLPKIVKALKAGNESMMPLSVWDGMALNSICRANVQRACKEIEGEFWSLSVGICTLKAAARKSAREFIVKEAA